MTRVITSPDCGNSPKNKLLQDLTIALARQDLRVLQQAVSDDVVWNIVGIGQHAGKADVAAAVQTRLRATVINVHHVAQHGKAGAVNGTLKYPGGAEEGFCHVFEFVSVAGMAVRAITSYVIDTA